MESTWSQINDPYEIKNISKTEIGFSHLREHKFRHGFKDTLNSPWSCSIEHETRTHSALFPIIETEPPLWTARKIFSFPFLRLVISI